MNDGRRAMGSRGSAMAFRRQDAYQRLEAIDAYRLRLAGWGIIAIAARADTTPHFVHRWLKEVAARDTKPAVPTLENLG
jgi:hypothetical protein